MGGGQSPPKVSAADYGKLYQTGVDVTLQNLPQLLAAEQQYRTSIDPQRVEDQQQLQQQFGPRQYQQQLDALHQLDPTGTALRTDLGHQVQGALDQGYNITDNQRTQIQQSVRGSEAARGNVLGNAPAFAETTAVTQAGERQRQQNIDNAGQFLSLATPEQQLLSVSSVQPDRSSGYVNPAAGTAGANFGLANYQNLLAQSQLSGGGGAWARAADGASKGSIGGPYGALGGFFDGLFNGPLYQTTTSDERLKGDIRFMGLTPKGLPVYHFSYNDIPNKMFIGTIAQHLREIMPEAVHESENGWLSVDYSMTDIPFEEIACADYGADIGCLHEHKAHR